MEMRDDVNFSYFALISFFSGGGGGGGFASGATEDIYFPEGKISSFYPDLHIQRVFACLFPSGASVSVWIFCNSCKLVP